MTSKPVIDFLTKEIFIEKNVVTYRSLSRELRLHVNIAKNELAIYHENAPYQSQISHATYLLCGEIDPPDVDEMSMDHEEGKELDGDYEYDGEDVPQTKFLLVNEADLEDAKLQFTRVNSMHIYSLAPSPLRDAGYICTPTEDVRAADRGKDGKELIKIVGKVVSANIKVVSSTSKTGKSTRQPIAGPSRMKAEVKEKEASVEPVKQKAKATGKLDFSKAKPKEHIKKVDVAMEASKVKKEKEKEKEKEKAKESERAKEEEKEQKKKTLEPAKRGTKRKSVLAVSDSEDDDQPSQVPSRRASPLPLAEKTKESLRVKGHALVSDDEDEGAEKAQPARKARKGRAAAAVDSENEDVLAMMDIDDDQVTRVSRESRPSKQVADEDEDEDYETGAEEKPAAAVDEDVDMLDDSVPKAKPKKRAPKKVVPVGSNGLKKRRVVKSRSKVDEKGYMVFEDYSEYESVDEDEAAAEAEKEKGKARGKSKAKAEPKEKGEQENGDESPAPTTQPKPAAKPKEKASAKAKPAAKPARESQATRANLAWLPPSLGSVFPSASSRPQTDSGNRYQELASEFLELEEQGGDAHLLNKQEGEKKNAPSASTTNTAHYTQDDDDDDEQEMIQTYGVAHANNAEPGLNAGEGSALLGGVVAKSRNGAAQKRDGHASIVSCISNLTNTIMGTGACGLSILSGGALVYLYSPGKVG
ncbi:hypothetical protein H0H87_002158 [Tephrocybe sp. NHM501043]|nr:hypothetical protein H0H87_002158 [Tephrocybe sp. NHM501043]